MDASIPAKRDGCHAIARCGLSLSGRAMLDLQLTEIDDATLAVASELDARPVTAPERLAAWLQRLGENTCRAYVRDLEVFAAFLGAPTAGIAIERLVQMPRARALISVERWRDAMAAPSYTNPRGLSSATINRRLAALNSALREIGKADIGTGRLDVRGIKQEQRHDNRGPALGKIARVIEELANQNGPAAVRDAAILRLLGQRGLRRTEVASLRVEDLNLDAREIAVQRKGRRERVVVTLAPTTCEALRAWLAVRVEHAKPDVTALFVGLGNAHHGLPIGASAIYEIVRNVGASVGAGRAWRPHGLRHSAVTAVLSRTGNLEAARVFAGHANVVTTQNYLDDGRTAEQSAVGAMDEAF